MTGHVRAADDFATIRAALRRIADEDGRPPLGCICAWMVNDGARYRATSAACPIHEGEPPVVLTEASAPLRALAELTKLP